MWIHLWNGLFFECLRLSLQVDIVLIFLRENESLRVYGLIYEYIAKYALV
jgi:hypothetical protein